MSNIFSLRLLTATALLGLTACAPMAEPNTPTAPATTVALVATTEASATAEPSATATSAAPATPTATLPNPETATPAEPYPPPPSVTPTPTASPIPKYPVCPRPAVAPLGFIGNNQLVSYLMTGLYPKQGDGVSIFNLDTHTEEAFLAYPARPFGLESNGYYPPNTEPFGIALAPDGQTLAWVVTNTIQLIDIPQQTVRNTLAPISPEVRLLAFAPAGDQLFAVLADGTLQTWGLNGQLLNSVHPAVRPFIDMEGVAGLDGLPKVVGMGVAPDGHTLALLGSDLVLWDLETQQPLAQYATSGLPDTYYLNFPGNVTFSPDGQLVGHGTGYGIGPATLWRVADGQVAWQALRTATYEEIGDVQMSSIAFSPNGRWLVVAEDKNDIATVSLFPVNGTRIGSSRTLPKPEEVQFADYKFSFSPDNTRLVAQVYHDNIGAEPIFWLVWEVETGKLEYVCEVEFLNFAPPGP